MIALRTCLEAGAVAGLAAALVFFVVHHVWIAPIWFVAPAGIPLAVVGGLATGWSYFHLQGAVPPPPWTPVAVLGAMLVVLTPGALLSLTHGPLFDVATATIPPGRGARVAVRFTLELLVTAASMGALLGWRLGGTAAAGFATALAGVALGIGPGHNIPMFGSHPYALKGFAMVVIVSATAAGCLPVAARVLARVHGV